jgi:hypothetical protein
MVFSRNQVREDYLPTLVEPGFSAYRGTPRPWAYRPHAGAQSTLVRRGLRLADLHLPLLDTTMVPCAHPAVTGFVDVPATRYVRACTPTLGRAPTLRFARSGARMHQAARTGGLVHLGGIPTISWAYPQDNLAAVAEILGVFEKLRRQARMVSRSTCEVADAIL